MDRSQRHVLEHHRRLVRAARDEVAAGRDVDDVMVDHQLMHLFSEVAETLDLDALGELNEWERATVALSVLDEMDLELSDALEAAHHDVEVSGAQVRARLEDLFAELAPCVPLTMRQHRRMAERAGTWLDENPEVVGRLLETASASNLSPSELLVALMSFMSGLDVDDRADLHRRFSTDPGAAMVEILARAEWSHQLELFDGSDELG